MQGVDLLSLSASERATLGKHCAAAATAEAWVRRKQDLQNRARVASIDGVEDCLALGLEGIDIGTALLLGHSCRPVKDNVPTKLNLSKRGDGFDVNEIPVEGNSGGLVVPAAIAHEVPYPVPDIMESEDQSNFAILANEYTRLEGYRWQTYPSSGHGTLFRMQLFGARGETVACPSFCEAFQPTLSPFIAAPNGDRLPTEWLQRGLGELCARLPRNARLPMEATAETFEDHPCVVLVIPAASLSIRGEPSREDFSRKAARRHPYYVEGVEMGARLRISVIAPANTTSGDLPTNDLAFLRRKFGINVFRIAGQTAHLCVRVEGGPPLDDVSLDGSALRDMCTYFTSSWSHKLGAAPSTWIQLFVKVGSASGLEKKIGHIPGGGTFATLLPEDAMKAGQRCFYCRKPNVVGYEMKTKRKTTSKFNTHQAQEADSASKDRSLSDVGLNDERLVCSSCSSFIPGSTAYGSKNLLCQYIPGRSFDQFVGTADEGLDHVCAGNDDRETKVHDFPRISDPYARAAHEKMWHGCSLGSQTVVLVVSAMIALAPPRGSWGMNIPEIRQTVQKELDMVAGRTDVVKITDVALDVKTQRLVVGFYILHPSLLLGAAVSETQDCGHALAPLSYCGLLLEHMFMVNRDGDVEGRLQKRFCDHQQKVLRPVDPNNMVSPGSALVCELPTVEVLKRAVRRKTMRLNEAMGQLATMIHKAEKEKRRKDKIVVNWQTSLQKSIGLYVEQDGKPNDDENNSLFLGALDRFRPSSSQIGLRLREAAACAQAAKCVQLLNRWCAPSTDDSLGAIFAVVWRDESHLRGQNTIDLALAAKDAETAATLLSFIPIPPEHLAGGADNSASDCATVLSSSTGTFTEKFGAHPHATFQSSTLSLWSGVSSEAARFPTLHGELVEPSSVRAKDGATIEEDVMERTRKHVKIASRAVCISAYRHVAANPDVSDQQQQAKERMLFEAGQMVTKMLNEPNPVTSQSPIHAACQFVGETNLGVLSDLVARKACVGALGPRGEVPSISAARRREKHVLSLLLSLRADPNARNSDRQPLLHYVIALARGGDNGLYITVVGDPRVNIDAVDGDGKTALMIALKAGHVEIARDLIARNCDVNKEDFSGAAPLLFMASIGDRGLCEDLLRQAADPETLDPVSRLRVAHVFAKHRNEHALRVLLQAHADVKTRNPANGRVLLHVVAATSWHPIVELLLDFQAEINIQCNVGDTPLRLAALNNDVWIAHLLLARGAEPNLGNRSGCAPIHAAASRGNVPLARLLHRYGADLNLPECRRWRPIHFAADSKNDEIVSWLLDKKADPVAKTFHGLLPVKLCETQSAVFVQLSHSIKDEDLSSNRRVPKLLATSGGSRSARSNLPPIVSRPWNSVSGFAGESRSQDDMEIPGIVLAINAGAGSARGFRDFAKK